MPCLVGFTPHFKKLCTPLFRLGFRAVREAQNNRQNTTKKMIKTDKKTEAKNGQKLALNPNTKQPKKRITEQRKTGKKLIAAC